MADRKTGGIFITLAMAYLVYTAVIVGHGIMPMNAFGTILLFAIGAFFLLRKEKIGETVTEETGNQ